MSRRRPPRPSRTTVKLVEQLARDPGLVRGILRRAYGFTRRDLGWIDPDDKRRRGITAGGCDE